MIVGSKDIVDAPSNPISHLKKTTDIKNKPKDIPQTKREIKKQNVTH